jgi:predicted glycosyltransferase involved in capsule biosynthesis
MDKPKISLLIPFRNLEQRLDQFVWLEQRWRSLGDDFEIIVSEDDGVDPFSRSVAVNNAYKRSTADILAVVDADLWLDPQIFLDAVKFITNNPKSWVRPCTDVYRIKKEITAEIIKQSPNDEFPNITEEHCHRISVATGGVCIFSRKQFETVGGMDPRFRGWGGEDNAWNIIMDRTFTDAQRWNKNLYHLWHPRNRDDQGKPAYPGQKTTNEHLLQEYKTASKNPVSLESLIKDNKKRTGI